MFHSTWGYIHHPHPDLLASVSGANLTVNQYQKSMSNVATLQVTPKMFLPSFKEEEHWSQVLKAQIGQALLGYVVEASDSRVPIPINPPEINTISSDAPNITMLKLMVASDNLAQGVGEVFESVTAQLQMNAVEISS
jgi:hypothetical protein